MAIPTLKEYIASLRVKFWKDAVPWARDNIVWGILVLVIPPIGVYLRRDSIQSTHVDWPMIRTTLYLYMIALGVYVFVHAVRTPWKVAQEARRARDEAIAAEQAKTAVAEEKASNAARDLAAERELMERPDVALVWDWAENERALLSRDESSKTILVHNRSAGWIYNICIDPIPLTEDLIFEGINEIKPGEQHETLARWGGTSTIVSTYDRFFASGENELAAARRGWKHEKIHNRGLSPYFLRIPMRLTYETPDKRMWESTYTFIFDLGLESLFEKISTQRLIP